MIHPKIIEILNLYHELYKQLKEEGLEYLLQRSSFGSREKEALRVIARLPHPYFASLDQVVDVCEKCSAGCLEFAFQIDHIGKIARQILRKANKYEEKGKTPEIPAEFPPSPQEYDIPSIGRMLKWSNEMMLHLARQTDITLKGRCPYCHGDLVVVIVNNELRLRCEQQSKPQCRKIDWFLHNVTPKKP